MSGNIAGDAYFLGRWASKVRTRLPGETVVAIESYDGGQAGGYQDVALGSNAL